MKLLKIIPFFILVCFSCKSKNNMIDANAIAKNMSAKKIARKHNAANFNKESLDSKLKVNFNNGNTKQSLSVQLKMKKDEVIYLRGTKLITVFKAKITPTSVSYYSPIAKHYFEGDFSMIKELLGVEINFEQLQNLFLGQSFENLLDEKQNVSIVANSYILSPEIQNALYDIFFSINPSHFKLNNQRIVNQEKNLSLDIFYPSYNVVENIILPSKINVVAKNSKRTTTIDLEYRSVEFNTDIFMSFKIPNGYKRLDF